MKTILAVFFVGLISLAVQANTIEANSSLQNDSSISLLAEHSCTADSISFSCSNGYSNVVPGCSVSCAENKSAFCKQGQPLIHSCSSNPPSCVCK